eukprot:4971674-Amphidinium_carterae.1
MKPSLSLRRCKDDTSCSAPSRPSLERKNFPIVVLLACELRYPTVASPIPSTKLAQQSAQNMPVSAYNLQWHWDMLAGSGDDNGAEIYRTTPLV